MNSLMTQGELKEEELASKLVCFGVDGVSAFQGFKFGLKFKSNVNMFHSSLLFIVWLIGQIRSIKTFSNLSLMFHIEGLYAYFSHNPKRHLEFTKLDRSWKVTTKYCKTSKLDGSMISQVNSVLSKYCNLFMKMALDAPIIASTKSNLRLLIDVEM
jgi:hypothetical protein